MRLDLLVSMRYPDLSRSRAAALIREGCVTVDTKTLTRVSTDVPDTAVIAITDSPLTRYVSRGGLKLEAALSAFCVDPAGLTVLDIGSSTGGFCDCLLQHGAGHAIALDVGKDQLHPKLRADARVRVMENTDLRDLDPTAVPPLSLITMDVSFISQRLLYPRIASLLVSGGLLVSLIKPQFEMEKRSDVGKGGVVRDEKKHIRCIENLKISAAACGLTLIRHIPSPIEGGDGNREYLALFRREL